MLRRAALVTTPFNVLFLCTGNSARSIMAEAILRKDGQGRFRRLLGGKHAQRVPSIRSRSRCSGATAIPSTGLTSKSWEVLAAADAPRMNFVLTVCDNAAGETCPLWPGQPISAHWGIEDPAVVEGSDIDKERAFVTAFRYLKNRVSLLISLPVTSLGRLALPSKLQEIGRMDGSTAKSAKVA